MANIANLPALTPEGGLNRYMQEIRKFPMLEPEHEYMLAKAWVEREDTGAAHKLVTSHLRLAAKIAMGYRGYGLPQAEVVSEANVGLMQAVKKFDPEKGFRLATYAMWWIRASIQEYVLRSWSMVKMGTMAVQKKLFFSLRRAKRRLEIIDNSQINPEQAKLLAQQFNLREKDIIDFNSRMTVRDQSLNSPISQSEEDSIEFQDTLVDNTPSPEALVAHKQEANIRSGFLKAALDELSERERDIFVERRLKDEPFTLEKIGKSYGISRERVRQLENRAFGKVQKAIREAASVE
jgi:RNA polymerase sigma-32 factor